MQPFLALKAAAASQPPKALLSAAGLMLEGEAQHQGVPPKGWLLSNTKNTFCLGYVTEFQGALWTKVLVLALPCCFWPSPVHPSTTDTWRDAGHAAASPDICSAQGRGCFVPVFSSLLV